ncbi:hypothetical protein ACFQ6N_08145 [Kitasatospora sp. NPDC056446]|uniref:hypothetical protein n=1 Tax=Kitasatospora sp. NPDC056446 TaxID=3345819 RepID=UPI0036C555CE
MSVNANGTGGANTGGDDGADLWVGLGLAEVAGGARIGPAPVADILAGGRRLRNRRRTAVGAVALASLVALTGGAMAQLRPDPASATQSAPAGAGTALVAPAAAPTAAPTEATPGPRDPFTPVRVRLGEGVANGKHWEIWQALWPLAPKDRAYEQAVAVWQERAPFDSNVAKPTPEYVAQYWAPNSDVINTYFVVDGVRIGHDSAGDTPAPGKLDPRSAADVSGGLFGRSSKDGIVPPADVVILSLGPDVGRVLVTWADGTTTEPQAVSVGDSPTRHMVVARPGTMRAKSWQFFDKNGVKLPDGGAKYLTEPVS